MKRIQMKQSINEREKKREAVEKGYKKQDLYILFPNAVGGFYFSSLLY